jgi:hypothetical protein
MALNAGHVCEIGGPANRLGGRRGHRIGASEPAIRRTIPPTPTPKPEDGHLRVAKEEFAFHMEHVREILRVQAPNQVPDVPDYVLVLTVPARSCRSSTCGDCSSSDRWR